MATTKTKQKEVFGIKPLGYSDQIVYGEGWGVVHKGSEKVRGSRDPIVAIDRKKGRAYRVASILNSIGIKDATLLIRCVSDRQSLETRGCMDDGLF